MTDTRAVVAIARDDDIGSAIREALGHLDLEGLFQDRSVAIKPNETYADAEDTTGVTQPDTLTAVVSFVRDRSPRELVVSGGAGAAETDEVFRHAGLSDVVRNEGVEFFDHNRPPFEDVTLSYPDDDPEVTGPQKAVKVNPRVLTYETLVALSQLKLHSTATVTMALKNIAMSYPAADYYGHPRRDEEHRHCFFDDMHSFIVAMSARFPISLAITVGHPAMIGTGPLGGHAVETGLVIASTDAVAADVVGAKLLGFQAQAVRHLWEAGRMGLGETDIANMDFPGMSLEDAAQAFSRAAYGQPLSLGTG